jgi:hypothetical protein
MMKYFVVLALVMSVANSSFAARRSAKACGASLDNPSQVAKDIELDAEAEARAIDKAANDLINGYAKFVKTYSRMPEETELAKEMEMSVSDLRKTMQLAGIDSFETLKLRAYEEKPANFKKAKDTDLFNAQETKKTVEMIREAQGGLIITSATAGQTLNESFFNMLLTKARRENLLLIIVPTNFITMNLPIKLLEAHDKDPNVRILTDAVDLLPELNLARFRPMPKNKSPFAGLKQLVVQLVQTIIVPSPKAERERVAHLDNEENPLDMISTGSVTNPEYKTAAPVQQRTSDIATLDHMMSALVLQKDKGGRGIMPFGGKPRYHIRRMDYLAEHDVMVDINVAYRSDGTVKTGVGVEAVILGDIHIDKTDPQAMKSLESLLLRLNPKYVVLHDIFNGTSVSPYEKDKSLTMSKLAQKGLLDIRDEVNRVRVFIESIARILPETIVIIPEANHNMWLVKAVQDFESMKLNRANSAYLSELMFAINNMGRDPLEYAVSTTKNDKDGVVEWEEGMRKRVVFMGLAARMKVGPDSGPTEIGSHGHLGINGARGSVNSMAQFSAKVSYDHTHSPMHKKFLSNSGTLTRLKVGYNEGGASNWGQAITRISEYGDAQLILFDKATGRWLEPLEEVNGETGSVFFPSNYPKVLPNNDLNPEVGDIVDQYSHYLKGRKKTK